MSCCCRRWSRSRWAPAGPAHAPDRADDHTAPIGASRGEPDRRRPRRLSDLQWPRLACGRQLRGQLLRPRQPPAQGAPAAAGRHGRHAAARARCPRGAGAHPVLRLPGAIGAGAAGADDRRRAESAEDDEAAEDEMLTGSSSEVEGSGDGDESGFMQDGQLRRPATEGARQSDGDAASLPQGAEDAGEAGDAPVVASAPVTSGSRAEVARMGEGGDCDLHGGEEDNGVDDFSDVCDDSDLFHTEAEDVGAPRADEDRTLEQLLGPDAASSLEKSIAVGLGEGFRQEDLRAALRTPAVERAVGAVLKDGIFEFLQTVDLLGNAVSRLPVLGPFRQQVVEGLRREVDRVLGAQIDGFLGRYTRLAAERTLLPLLTADGNRAELAKSAGQLTRYALGQQVRDVLPPPGTAAELRREALQGLRGLDAAAAAREVAAAARRLLRKRPEPAVSPAVVSATMGPLNDALESQLRRFLPAVPARAPPGGGGGGAREVSDALAAELLESPALAGLAGDRRQRLRDSVSLDESLSLAQPALASAGHRLQAAVAAVAGEPLAALGVAASAAPAQPSAGGGGAAAAAVPGQLRVLLPPPPSPPEVQVPRSPAGGEGPPPPPAEDGHGGDPASANPVTARPAGDAERRLPQLRIDYAASPQKQKLQRKMAARERDQLKGAAGSAATGPAGEAAPGEDPLMDENAVEALLRELEDIPKLSKKRRQQQPRPGMPAHGRESPELEAHFAPTTQKQHQFQFLEQEVPAALARLHKVEAAREAEAAKSALTKATVLDLFERGMFEMDRFGAGESEHEAYQKLETQLQFELTAAAQNVFGAGAQALDAKRQDMQFMRDHLTAKRRPVPTDSDKGDVKDRRAPCVLNFIVCMEVPGALFESGADLGMRLQLARGASEQRPRCRRRLDGHRATAAPDARSAHRVHGVGAADGTDCGGRQSPARRSANAAGGRNAFAARTRRKSTPAPDGTGDLPKRPDCQRSKGRKTHITSVNITRRSDPRDIAAALIQERRPDEFKTDSPMEAARPQVAVRQLDSHRDWIHAPFTAARGVWVANEGPKDGPILASMNFRTSRDLDDANAATCIAPSSARIIDFAVSRNMDTCRTGARDELSAPTRAAAARELGAGAAPATMAATRAAETFPADPAIGLRSPPPSCDAS
ncbi:unnamed protein product [Prorocentrum cordatum]|uniref:Uncharacterized protein n=1 Tax=Prorocentrum cordatum TaxID=2364126 RepID=A0ABN9WWA5_9DINO|nr:unnamed protein product [Polarella glacialis]